MGSTATGSVTTELACDVCSRLSHPHRFRLTLAKLVAVFPVELLLHAVVIYYHLSYALTVALLTVATTILVIWVVEPSAMRLLRTWLHAPVVRARERLDEAAALWRIRVTVDDKPGALESLAHNLARLDANILTLHVHPLDQGSLDELIVATPGHVHAADLIDATEAGGGVEPHVWPTSALALVDGQTKALTLAARVTANPGEFPLAVAELLGAQVITGRRRIPGARSRARVPNKATLHIPSPWNDVIVVYRPDEPFTPAESARANRLAEVAVNAAAALRRR
ncbi:MAG: amino acid-binding protein [Actinomycetota bacterium]|nr:amino acid-binding protein [Actinomycetota bacterium]